MKMQEADPKICLTCNEVALKRLGGLNYGPMGPPSIDCFSALEKNLMPLSYGAPPSARQTRLPNALKNASSFFSSSRPAVLTPEQRSTPKGCTA